MTKNKTLFLTILSFASVFASIGTAQVAATPNPTSPSDQTVPNRITALLKAAQTTAQIRGATGQNRDAIYAGVEASVATSSHALAELRRNSDRLRADARVKLTAAVNEARACEMELRQSLTAAREATAENASNANETLAANYQNYADSVARVESTAAASANSHNATR